MKGVFQWFFGSNLVWRGIQLPEHRNLFELAEVANFVFGQICCSCILLLNVFVLCSYFLQSGKAFVSIEASEERKESPPSEGCDCGTLGAQCAVRGQGRELGKDILKPRGGVICVFWAKMKIEFRHPPIGLGEKVKLTKTFRPTCF